jgi:hypothetical protein
MIVRRQLGRKHFPWEISQRIARRTSKHHRLRSPSRHAHDSQSAPIDLVALTQFCVIDELPLRAARAQIQENFYRIYLAFVHWISVLSKSPQTLSRSSICN